MDNTKILIDTFIGSITGYDWFEVRWVSSEPEHFIKCKISSDNDEQDMLDWIDKFTFGRFYILEECSKAVPGTLYMFEKTCYVVGFEDPNDATIFLLKFR